MANPLIDLSNNSSGNADAAKTPPVGGTPLVAAASSAKASSSVGTPLVAASSAAKASLAGGTATSAKTPPVLELKPESKPTAAPKAPVASSKSAAASPKPLDENLSFSNIFTQSKPTEKDSKMVRSIIAQKDALQQMKPILGSAPDLEKTLEMEKQYRLKRKLRLVQTLFVIVFVLSAGLFGFLYTQLSPDFGYFGANVTQRLTDENSNLRKLQTDLNKVHYLTAQQNLNNFSYQADRFFGNMIRSQDPNVTAQDKAVALANIEAAKKTLPNLLADIRVNLTAPFVAQTFQSLAEPAQTDDEKLSQAEEDLRTAIQEDKRIIGPKPTSTDDIQTGKLLDNTLKLVGNRQLINTIQSISLDDFKKSLEDFQATNNQQNETHLRDLIGKILSSTNSELATIADVKHTRILWSTILKRIDGVTAEVYAAYNPPIAQDSIHYTGYDFDTATNKIVLSGATKTTSGANFTLMSDLMAHLEQSPYFQKIEMRSFSKNKQGDGTTTAAGYSANFKIDLKLSASGS